MNKLLILLLVTTSIYASDTVIVDNLEWQDNTEAKTTTHTWSDAIAYCQALSLNGHSDWYLPSIKELQSIVDVSRNKPAIKKNFKNVASSNYWSSSQNVSAVKYAWYVSFKVGFTNNFTESKEYYVRCVRHRQ